MVLLSGRRWHFFSTTTCSCAQQKWKPLNKIAVHSMTDTDGRETVAWNTVRRTSIGVSFTYSQFSIFHLSQRLLSVHRLLCGSRLKWFTQNTHIDGSKITSARVLFHHSTYLTNHRTNHRIIETFKLQLGIYIWFVCCNRTFAILDQSDSLMSNVYRPKGKHWNKRQQIALHLCFLCDESIWICHVTVLKIDQFASAGKRFDFSVKNVMK